jgi:hypothetical protein
MSGIVVVVGMVVIIISLSDLYMVQEAIDFFLQRCSGFYFVQTVLPSEPLKRLK